MPLLPLYSPYASIFAWAHQIPLVLLGKVRFILGGGGGGELGQGNLEFFGEKSRGPPPSWNGLMHHLSEIPKQKHFTLPLPIQDKNNRK